jgi:glutamyl-tRNA reductase
MPDVLAMLRTFTGHGVILSTCNRTEIYTVKSDGRDNGSAGLDFLTSYFDVTEAELAGHTYHHTEQAAVEHLFRVACGLDSMIIGEFEILGQLRQALDSAEEAGLVNLPLRRIFQDAIRTGRQVRDETGISRNALSVSSVAVDLATGIVGDLDRCRTLVIGAGEAGKLVAQTAKEKGTRSIRVASRTFERSSALADTLGGAAIEFDHIIPELSSCDLVITCADAPHYILNPEQVSPALPGRNGFPLVIIDIAVPRNVEPAVGDLDHVFLYNIDDLNQISEQNRTEREREIDKAERIIAAEVAKFIAWWQHFSVRPIISALMDKAHRIRTAHLHKTLKKLPPLSEEQRYSLEKMTEAIIVKLLGDPISSLKEHSNGDGEYARMVSQLFRLDEERPD